jgi:hypothetical protein
MPLNVSYDPHFNCFASILFNFQKLHPLYESLREVVIQFILLMVRQTSTYSNTRFIAGELVKQLDVF